MITVDITRTYYPHWGEYSGIHQFVPHLAPDKYSIRLNAVPMGDDTKIPQPFKKIIKKKIKENNIAAYELNDFSSELSILSRALSGSMDIIHLLDAEHSLMFLPTWLRWLKYFKRCPKVIAMFHQPADILDRLINKDIVNLVDCVLVVAPEQVEYFRQFMPEKKIKMILHGINTQYFVPGRNKRKDKFKCLAAGVWLRDYDAVIETARLLKHDSRFEFHIIASKLQVPKELENITVHRNIPDAEMLKLYQGAHVLFMPLETATANNVLLEGSACGLPVISTEMNSVKTYFPGEEALLVKDNAPDEFAAILKELSQNRSRLDMLSQRARTRAKELSWENIAKEYGALYETLCCVTTT